MADKAWKACERRVAKYIGGERVPITGRQRGSAPDIQHPWLSPEVKYRSKTSGECIPKWLHEAMAQAEASARTRQMPCVILVEKGQEVGEAFICFRLRDAREHWL